MYVLFWFSIRSSPKSFQWKREEENNPHHSPLGPRPKLLHLLKAASPLSVWSTNLSSWKYYLPVKSPTLDGLLKPLKTWECFQIYYCKRMHLSLQGLPFSWAFLQPSFLMFVPAEGNQEPRSLLDPCLYPEKQGRRDFWLWSLWDLDS